VLSRVLGRGFDRGRLRGLLVAFFLLLAIPTTALIWQAYGQLKWESFHQYRGMAEELTVRIDDDFIERIASAEARTFADYSFLTLTGDPSANFLQRSPLSQYPVREALPGTIGHFQVATDGAFSTPLLPQQGSDPAALGIAAAEYEERLLLAMRLQEILAANRLVQARSPAAELQRVAQRSAAVGKDTGDKEVGEQAARQYEAEPSVAAPATVDVRITAGLAGDDGLRDSIDPAPRRQAAGIADDDGAFYSQQVFDELAQADDVPMAATEVALEESDVRGDGTRQNMNSLGKVSDLKLDAAYERKSEELEQARSVEPSEARARQAAAPRAKRIEANTVPEIVVSGNHPESAAAAGRSDLRISTFASEVDPFEFSQLDSGHFVLFRKVWRDGERYIQGMLIEQQVFLAGMLEERFRETGVSGVTNLIVAYRDDLIQNFPGGSQRSYPNGSQSFDGALLYRNRLSAPLESLELIYSINRLPPGPGAGVLAWVTLALGVVFCGGFFALYRLGLGQIDLARQQQDFVSAVSHELKTPLTSIRMYGEMLKEGWADPEKRQHYYEYIHDESERLTRLIANVLQLASITRNDPQVVPQPVTVDTLLDQVSSKIADQVSRAGFDLHVRHSPADEHMTISIDVDCFTQIVINLVDNAIKFSKQADIKRVDISSSSARDGRAIFAVRDYGAGIRKDQMKKIFKLFYRSESELTRETVGTGIGLAIVHQLTLAMGGKVDVVNRDPGAEFRISFPLVAV